MLKIRFGAVPVTDVKMPQYPEAAQPGIRALIVPVREDGVVVGRSTADTGW